MTYISAGLLNHLRWVTFPDLSVLSFVAMGHATRPLVGYVGDRRPSDQLLIIAGFSSVYPWELLEVYSSFCLSVFEDI